MTCEVKASHVSSPHASLHKLQVIFRKRATNYRALLREITCKDKASHVSSPHYKALVQGPDPLCKAFSPTTRCWPLYTCRLFYRALLQKRPKISDTYKDASSLYVSSLGVFIRVVSFIELFCKRDLKFEGAYHNDNFKHTRPTQILGLFCKRAL